MSKYDGIKTAAELVREVKNHGLSTVQEDLNRAADIIGNSEIGELVRLANDIGRNNENGEPDPKGTRSSNRIATQNTFYSIISHVWHWEEVTRFWNQHTNPEHEELSELRGISIRLGEENKALVARRAELLEDAKRGAEYISSLNSELAEARARAEAAEAEVVQLKARLYDLLYR